MRLFLCVSLCFGILSSTAFAQTKIGYVDFQRALLETQDGKNAKKALETMKKTRQKELDSEQKALKTLQEKLTKQRAFMQPKVLQQKEQEFRQKVQRLQMTFAKLQKELAAEEAKLTRNIIQRMGVILAAIGKRDGYSVILEKTESRILWAPQKLDLTNELIREYSAAAKKSGKKAKKTSKKKK
jgi:outer membrane protein